MSIIVNNCLDEKTFVVNFSNCKVCNVADNGERLHFKLKALAFSNENSYIHRRCLFNGNF
jgi:hypothetical protein